MLGGPGEHLPALRVTALRPAAGHGVPRGLTLPYRRLNVSWAASSSAPSCGAPTQDPGISVHRALTLQVQGLTQRLCRRGGLLLTRGASSLSPIPGAAAPPAVSWLREDPLEVFITPSRNKASLSLPYPGERPALALTPAPNPASPQKLQIRTM